MPLTSFEVVVTEHAQWAPEHVPGVKSALKKARQVRKTKRGGPKVRFGSVEVVASAPDGKVKSE